MSEEPKKFRKLGVLKGIRKLALANRSLSENSINVSRRKSIINILLRNIDRQILFKYK